MESQTANIIALAGLAASLITIWIALRTYNLSNNQEARQQPRLIVSIRDEWVKPEGANIVIALLLRVENISAVSNYVREVRLHIHYHESNGRVLPIVLEADLDQARHFANRHGEALDIGRAIGSHEMRDGVVYFSLPTSVYQHLKIETYSLQVMDMVKDDYKVAVSHLKEYRD